ncbi:protein unc-13 homolog isoform X2 [Punica granatum]|nr:protein unc-13 homolog isoform X2 [Punica granatum]
MGKRAETIILPLELLRHLKPSEFNDSHEYHIWQKRQLKILEAGLLLHPSIPLEKSNAFAVRLRDIIRSSESGPIDTGKNSDTMRTLFNSVVSLAWRSANGTPTDVCHWADGYPVNVHLYVALLQSIFDIRDETSVLDEVDELLELMKKTWSTLGINRPIHNVCLTWVLFHQYVATSQLEPDLLGASHTMLTEVAADAKKPDRDALFLKVMSSVLASIREWSEKRLFSYHDYFQKGTISVIDNLLPLALTAMKIIGEDILLTGESPEKEKEERSMNSQGNRVDGYIRSSLKNAFKKVIEGQSIGCVFDDKQEASEALLKLAEETEALALNEKEHFSPILKKWHSIASGVAAVTLHSCYGAVLKHYLNCASQLSNETVEVLHRSGKLENVLVQMVVEDSGECEDGGKTMVRQMVPYEVDSIILGLVKQWIDERLQKGQHCLEKAKDTETWNPKSKTEPYARSAVELMKLAKETIHDFFEIPVEITEDLVQDLADALEQLFEEYIAVVASCGSKQNYMPVLPPMTRCHRDSKFMKLCKRATPCSIALEDPTHHHMGPGKEGLLSRPTTSRGTQRLYIRLNTLHYLLTYLNSLDKTLSISRRDSRNSTYFSANNRHRSNKTTSSSYFDSSRSSIAAACQLVSEVAAYRLTFLDSNSMFYESLYVGDMVNTSIQPVLQVLKQNLTLLCAILNDRAQPLAIKEVMKASFEAYLMVLLAGGHSRVFYRSDHEMIEEDFRNLKKTFSTCGEGLIPEDVMEKEAEIVEGVIDLMGESTEQLIEDYNAVTSEASGKEVVDAGHKLPMPPTTGKWNRTDPNTILRVLCHRVDRTANQYLKRSFHLGKKR